MAKLTSIAVTAVIWSAWIVWVTRTHPWEGPVLFSFDRGHGVHRNDLWALLVATVITVVAWLPHRSRRK